MIYSHNFTAFIRKKSQSYCLIAQIPTKVTKWDRDMSEDSIALFLDTECMTFFKEWDIDIVHATFIPFR